MKSGKTLVELAREIERRANAKKDFLVSTENLTMTSGPDAHGVGLILGGKEVLGVNNIAHEQIATQAGIPQKYYNRMLAEAPQLLADNVNAWFTKYPALRMVRSLDGNARALLSDKYRPLENEDLAQAVLPPLMDLGLEIMSSEITDRRLYIKAIDPKVGRELAKQGAVMGDGGHTIIRCLAPAITISNSEVGGGALSIMAGTYDSFCSNLATFGERSMRKYHVGAKHDMGEDVFAQLSDKTRKLTDAALWAQVGEIVKLAFDRAAFDALVDKIEGTKADRIGGDPVKVIELSAKRFNLSGDEKTNVLRHLIEGGELNRFGLHNAITRASQDVADYDRATELERAGGNVIELNRHDWEELALAA